MQLQLYISEEYVTYLCLSCFVILNILFVKQTVYYSFYDCTNKV